MDLGTPLGLAFASGINAYLPMLSFAIATRFFHLYKVNPNFAFITSNWCIAALVLLTLLDFVADKIPVIDHIWDVIHTAIRPIAGALIAAASYGQVTINTHATSSSLLPVMQSAGTGSHLLGTVLTAGSAPLGVVGLVLMLLLGGVLAATSHTAKATTRLVSTATTAGFFNIVLSIVEDVVVVILVLISLFVPVIMLILIGLFLIFFGPRVMRTWRKWRTRHQLVK